MGSVSGVSQVDLALSCPCDCPPAPAPAPDLLVYGRRRFLFNVNDLESYESRRLLGRKDIAKMVF